MAGRCLVIGLDATEPDLVRRWAAAGLLPNIAALMSRGTSGAVQGVEGFYVGSTWPSFYTGLNPAGHGFYRTSQLASGSYDFFCPLDTPTGMGGTPLWSQVSRAGRRVAVVDVPLTRVDPDVNGLHVVGWGDFEAPTHLRSSLPAEISTVVGDYPLSDVLERPRRTVDEFAHFVALLEAGVEKKTTLTLELLAREDWDLFIQVFTECHNVGHQCWHLHDPASPAHDPRAAAEVGDPLERVYRAVDRGIGAILERAGDALVLAVSGHGMSSWRGGNFVLNEILYRLGATARPAVETSRLGEVLDLLRVTDNPLRRRLRTRYARERPKYPEPRNVLEWADVYASRCFSVPNGFPVSGIRLNLAGREPRGVLQPGSEADAFYEQLRSDLLSVVDDATGSPVIESVDCTASLWEGERLDALPDLLVRWSEAFAVGTKLHAGGRESRVRLRSESIGVVEGVNGYYRTGDHVPRGFFACVGPGVPSADSGPVHVTDFYPTICDLLDVPIPAVDGTVIPELARLWTEAEAPPH